jgi:hypothetical protein
VTFVLLFDRKLGMSKVIAQRFISKLRLFLFLVQLVSAFLV